VELKKANFLWENEKMAEVYRSSVNHGKLDIGFRFAKLI
jgi:hypothetical protein